MMVIIIIMTIMLIMVILTLIHHVDNSMFLTPFIRQVFSPLLKKLVKNANPLVPYQSFQGFYGSLEKLMS